MNEQQEREFELMKSSIITQAKFNNHVMELLNKLFSVIQAHQGSLNEISIANFREQIDKLNVCDGCEGKHCACKGGN